jgi:hypothetical protein
MPSEFSQDRILAGDLSAEEIQTYYEELQNSDELLHFNGINGATGTYGVAPMSGTDLASIIKGEPKPANLGELEQKQAPGAFPIKPPNDATKLDQAGWAVIFPAQTNPAIKEALSELTQLRQEQAGERFRIYEGADGYRPGETKDKFFKRHKVGGGPADPEQMPYYALIVGSPEEIPYDFQYQLDVMRGVGRIHFDTLEDYASYARSVKLAETGQVKLPRRAGFFGVANPDDKATELSSKYLVSPLHQKLQEIQPFTRWVEEGDIRRKLQLDWQFDSFLAEQATKAQLGRLLGGEQTPALLFTASHGMEFPQDDSRQIPHQGALLCQDWPGPNQWRGAIGQDFYFAGDDLGSDVNVLGLIAFCFACFGAGTPRLDQFARQAFKDQREVIAPHNFIGGLPKRLLSRGALAVIGHVERAWGYSFLSPGVGTQTGTFESTLLQLFSGDPVGWTTESLNMRYADLATALATILEELDYDPNYINPYDLAQKWTEHNDSRSYVVIGDPAVRIPLALPDETPMEERPHLGTISVSTGTIAPEVKAQAAPAHAPEPSAGAPEDAESFAVAFGLRDQFNDLTGSVKKFTDQLATALKDAAEDIMTLEVKTYAVDDLEAVAQGQGQTKLRALTRIEFDGDIQVYVPVGKGKIDEELRQIHLDMVREAQANRAQFLSAMAEMATNLLKSLK